MEVIFIMKKRIGIVCILLGVLCVCCLVIFFLLRSGLITHDSHSYDTVIDVKNNSYRISEIESELYAIIGKMEEETENVELRYVEYHLNSDGTGSVLFSFQFDRPDTGWFGMLQRFTSRKPTGNLELWISLPESTVTHVSYNYGYIRESSPVPRLSVKKDMDIEEYYHSLLEDREYLAYTATEPVYIKIKVINDTISASVCSMDENEILYTFR